MTTMNSRRLINVLVLLLVIRENEDVSGKNGGKSIDFSGRPT